MSSEQLLGSKSNSQSNRFEGEDNAKLTNGSATRASNYALIYASNCLVTWKRHFLKQLEPLSSILSNSLRNISYSLCVAN